MRLLLELGLELRGVPGLGLRLESRGGLSLRVWMPRLGWMNVQDGWGLRRMWSLKLGSVLGRGVDRL